MYNIPEKLYRCTYCQEPLKGRVKASMVNKNYISFKGGALSLQMYDKDSDWRSYFFITPKPTDDGQPVEMNFCDVPCFDGYIKYKFSEYNNMRKERLREEAGREMIDRSANEINR